MKRTILLALLASTSLAHAEQVPKPLNAPSSSTAGHILTVHSNNGQQADDGGVLGTAAHEDTGTSGSKVAKTNGANTWSTTQTFTVAPIFTDKPGTRTALDLGSAYLLNQGSSVVNRGDAQMEIAQVPQSVTTGTNVTWASNDMNKLQVRFNSGVAMADTLPASNGTEGTFVNKDTVDDTFTVTGGGTISYQGVSSSSFVLHGGRYVAFVGDGFGNYSVWFTNNDAVLTGGTTSCGFTSGVTANLAANTTYYFPIQGFVQSTTLTEANAQVPAPCSGTAGHLNLHLASAPGTGNNVAFTLRKAGSASALTITCSNSITDCTDSTHGVTIAEGDLLALQLISSASATITRFSASWRVTN